MVARSAAGERQCSIESADSILRGLKCGATLTTPVTYAQPLTQAPDVDIGVFVRPQRARGAAKRKQRSEAIGERYVGRVFGGVLAVGHASAHRVLQGLNSDGYLTAPAVNPET